MKILENEITGTRTSLSANFGDKLSFTLSFLFPELLHCYYIYFHCSHLYNYYNYSPILTFADTIERGDRGESRPKERVKIG